MFFLLALACLTRSSFSDDLTLAACDYADRCGGTCEGFDAAAYAGDGWTAEAGEACLEWYETATCEETTGEACLDLLGEEDRALAACASFYGAMGGSCVAQPPEDLSDCAPTATEYYECAAELMCDGVEYGDAISACCAENPDLALC